MGRPRVREERQPLQSALLLGDAFGGWQGARGRRLPRHRADLAALELIEPTRSRADEGSRSGNPPCVRVRLSLLKIPSEPKFERRREQISTSCDEPSVSCDLNWSLRQSGRPRRWAAKSAKNGRTGPPSTGDRAETVMTRRDQHW